jgi:hypothetical protein
MGPLLTTARAALQQTLLESDTPEQPTDQRARGRYPIAMELQYKVLRGGRVEQTGTGRTLNISSGGVLFQTDDRLPHRGRVELAMQWPYLLQGVCGLKLVMRGPIVRSGGDSKVTAVRAEFREFRTAGVRRTQDGGASAAISAR